MPLRYKKEITLKDGQDCLLRSAVAEDAQEILEHQRITSAETDFMARYPDEICDTPEKEAYLLQAVEADPHSIMLSAFVSGNLVGSASVFTDKVHSRCGHRGDFGISVKQKYWNEGIGSALLQACLEAAQRAGLEQVELGVVDTNLRAFHLYRRFGFQIYGMLPNAFRYRDGSYAGEYEMVCKFSEQK
ncbi:hypothetical protein B6259_06950 [Ruminococcaceae bacterium CPB6]|nr:hypothetical protein B6259_06950 [Ruminococcaceae bacterium CPB6]